MNRTATPLLALLLFAAPLGAPLRAAEPDMLPAKAVRPFLESHCLTCHDSNQKKGGLDLDKLTADVADPKTFAAWVKVFDRVRLGEMPPKSVKTRPEKAEADALLKGLETALVAADRKRVEAAGRAVVRRLNRTEYENTLRDLLNLPGLNVRDLLPDDGRAFGYDKSGTALE